MSVTFFCFCCILIYSFESRIITIVDAYDAMSSERSYRGALPNEVVIKELQKNAGIQFDPELVKIFVEKVLGKEK